MLWLSPLPWARWSLVALAIVFAGWIELKPTPTVEVPFAVAPIHPGDRIEPGLVEFRTVPNGLFEGAVDGDIASRAILPGEPILSSHVDDVFRVVPQGWWVISVVLPDGAHVGDPVRLVLLESGEEIDGVVAHPGSDDPFASSDGGVAIPPESAGAAAVAAANGRIAVLVSTG